MSSGYQKHIVIGNLGSDPQVSTLEGGKEVVTFSLACNDGPKDADATWYNCKAWDKIAQTLKEYAKKGALIVAEMRYTPRQYTPEGYSKKITYPEFTVDRFRFLGGQNSGGGQTRFTDVATPAQPVAVTTSDSTEPDELPF